VRLQKQAELSRPIRINKFFDDLSLGIFSPDLMKKRAKELELDIVAKHYITMVIEYADQKLLLTHNDQLLAFDVIRIVKDIVSDDPDVYHFRKDMHNVIVINKGDDADRLQKKAVSLANKLRHAILENTSADKALFSIGGVREGFAGIAESLADAKLILDFKYLFSENDTIIMEQSLLKRINKTNGQDLSLNTEINLIENLLKFGSKDEIQLVVDKLASKLKTLQFSRIYYQYICMDLIKRIEIFLTEIGEDSSHVMITQIDNPFCIDQWLKWSSDINIFAEFLTKLLHRVIELREQKKNYKYCNFIVATVKYIDENYSNSALSLNDAASYANISSSYFSTLFSQEMGESFIDYLTRKRISRAKELLKTTSMRLIDIAFEVGYQDSNYFSKIFKKLTGMSPRDYRSS
jgi:two-component system response regulator YesN